jgi:hypothetical protein
MVEIRLKSNVMKYKINGEISPTKLGIIKFGK